MRNIPNFVDERQKTWCVHCARTLASDATNRDHVPTKSLLRDPYPTNLPVVEVCADCNHGFSKDEQYFVAFLSAVVSGSTDPAEQRHPNAARIFETQPALRARIGKSMRELLPFGDKKEIEWQPEADRIERVILKNARGHAFFEFGEPMLQHPSRVSFAPLQSLSESSRQAFENVPSNGLFPEIGSRMMTRVITGQDLDGPWVMVQDGTYRYAVAQVGTMVVRSVIFEYLATEVYWR